MDEIILCFPGILASLIPGFDDNDEKTKKLIFQSFEDFINKFKEQNQQQIFFGAFWTLLLRNQHLRNGGMKYLMEKVILYDDLIEKTKEEQQSLIEFYYPNINSTVINAIGEIILDKEISVVRNGNVSFYYFYPKGTTQGLYGFMATNTTINGFNIGSDGRWIQS